MDLRTTATASPRTAASARVATLGGATAVTVACGAALLARALDLGRSAAVQMAAGMDLRDMLRTARVEELVEIPAVAVGAGVCAWLSVGLLLAVTCSLAGLLGRRWTAGERLVARIAPRVVRRALVLTAGTGVALAGAGLPAMADVAVPSPDLGWRPTADAPAWSTPSTETPLARPAPEATGATSPSAASGVPTALPSAGPVGAAPSVAAPATGHTAPPASDGADSPAPTGAGFGPAADPGPGPGPEPDPGPGREAEPPPEPVASPVTEPAADAPVITAPPPAATSTAQPSAGTVATSSSTAVALPAPTTPPPDHASGTATSGPGPSSGVVTVRVGDSLWGIAADFLPAGATAADVAAAWPAWYAANEGLIGDDPDLIRPGQRLVAPSVGAAVQVDGAGS
jgi:LysM repeat protein